MRRSRLIVGVVSDLLLWTVLIGIGVGVVFSLFNAFFLGAGLISLLTPPYTPAPMAVLIPLGYIVALISTSVLGIYLLKRFGPVVVRRRQNRMRTLGVVEPADDPSAIEPRG